MKYVRHAIALMLLPVLVALAWNFLSLVVNLGKHASLSVLPFWAGLAGYFVFQAVFSRPLKTYVFGHELTHALVGLVSGARLKSFKVSVSGGSVVLTKTNIWITLAPYFLPLYTIIIIAIYRSGSYFWPWERVHPYFLFLSGFSLSFHFSLTHFALRQGQSDLKLFGTLFSGVFASLVSVIILLAVFKALFPEAVNARMFLYQSIQRTIVVYDYIYVKARGLWYFSMPMS